MKARAARDGFVHGGVQYGLCVRWCHYSAWGEQRKVRAAAQYFEDVDARDKCRALQRKYQELRHTTHPRSIDALREALLQDIVTGTWDAEGYKTCLVILRGRNHPAITQKLLHDAQRKGVAFTAPLTSEFMRACVNKRIDADLFEAVWTAAAQSGFVHRGMQYGLYVGLLLRQGRFQDAHRIYISLFSGGRKRRFADPKLLARLIAASPSVSLAWVMFNTMGREEAAASPENVPNNIPRHIMYDALLGARTTQTQRAVWSGASGYQDARRARSRAAARDLVARVLGTMRADGVRPGQGTFLAVLNHYKDHGDLDAVTDSLATFQRLRFVMEEKAYAIVIRTCSIATTRPNDRAARLAEAAYERAANDGHEYDRVITSAMMQVYAGCGDAVRAAGLLDRVWTIGALCPAPVAMCDGVGSC
eukprot:TRINITY_DN5390_c0_g3_i2.p1 TRINITY_DN5390_c0_g3~~TRINITY_DN5390_c0_g3_i2.p1  ORF type:complete len:419 (+),score=103.95 TRINITY_DN5390_c0_g3_i2:133-1389(+)